MTKNFLPVGTRVMFCGPVGGSIEALSSAGTIVEVDPDDDCWLPYLVKFDRMLNGETEENATEDEVTPLIPQDKDI